MSRGKRPEALLSGRAARLGALLAALCAACSERPASYDWSKYQAPDWRKYQAKTFVAPPGPDDRMRGRRSPGQAERYTFGDLKFESDEKLASRLLGDLGRRIAFIDRHRHRWYLYDGDDQAAESIDLYTPPSVLGSQFGLCGVEKYSIEFDDDGHVSSVSVSQRYGVEGPIFQKDDFDWDQYHNVMCASAPPAHAPSYFPATDSQLALDAARLLAVASDLASMPGNLPFDLKCDTPDGEDCRTHIRKYLGRLRFEEIDDFGLVNCTLRDTRPGSICFTIMTGDLQVGPYPKHITIKGSTHQNNVRLDSVDVLMSMTIS